MNVKYLCRLVRSRLKPRLDDVPEVLVIPSECLFEYYCIASVAQLSLSWRNVCDYVLAVSKEAGDRICQAYDAAEKQYKTHPKPARDTNTDAMSALRGVIEVGNNEGTPIPPTHDDDDDEEEEEEKEDHNGDATQAAPSIPPPAAAAATAQPAVVDENLTGSARPSKEKDNGFVQQNGLDNSSGQHTLDDDNHVFDDDDDNSNNHIGFMGTSSDTENNNNSPPRPTLQNTPKSSSRSSSSAPPARQDPPGKSPPGACLQAAPTEQQQDDKGSSTSSTVSIQESTSTTSTSSETIQTRDNVRLPSSLVPNYAVQQRQRQRRNDPGLTPPQSDRIGDDNDEPTPGDGDKHLTGTTPSVSD